jgi:hypothetical protein
VRICPSCLGMLRDPTCRNKHRAVTRIARSFILPPLSLYYSAAI